MNECMKIVANLFLVREHEAREHKDYSAAVAYANAYDWLNYAIENREDCISQFDGYDKAKEMTSSL